jgi:hypothetical protein
MFSVKRNFVFFSISVILKLLNNRSSVIQIAHFTKVASKFERTPQKENLRSRFPTKVIVGFDFELRKQPCVGEGEHGARSVLSERYTCICDMLQ